jgi:hypothetical protein
MMPAFAEPFDDVAATQLITSQIVRRIEVTDDENLHPGAIPPRGR